MFVTSISILKLFGDSGGLTYSQAYNMKLTFDASTWTTHSSIQSCFIILVVDQHCVDGFSVMQFVEQSFLLGLTFPPDFLNERTCMYVLLNMYWTNLLCLTMYMHDLCVYYRAIATYSVVVINCKNMKTTHNHFRISNTLWE